MCQSINNLNIGRQFEARVYKELLDLKQFDCIYDEIDLRKQYGWDSSGIDFLVVKGNIALAIQLKWRKSRRRESIGIEKFLNSLSYVKQKSGETNAGYNLAGGLYISRLEPFEDNKEKLREHNIISLSCFESMESLVEQTKRSFIFSQ